MRLITGRTLPMIRWHLAKPIRVADLERWIEVFVVTDKGIFIR